MGYFAFSERQSKWLRRLLPMNKRDESSIETTADGGWSAADTDVFETRPTDFTNQDHRSCSTTEMDGGDAVLSSSTLAVSKQAGRNEAKQTLPTTTKTQNTLSESTFSSPAGPSSSAVTVSPLADADVSISRQVSLAPRGAVFRYFGAADDDSALPVGIKTVHSTNVYLFNSGVHHNPSALTDNVPGVPPPSSDRFIPIDPPLLAPSSLETTASNSSSTVDSRCSSVDYIHSSSTYEVQSHLHPILRFLFILQS
uniref:Uncharacterized protein n=1 Tax=Skeletonema marinoi TaxID=267567 RepID=A0A7S2VHR6_9STRA|mmetsp:Transcript_9090/g.15458  ORF Transcript_9090/g.15458 Transcript_9090/m.15458 type:complete len:254 (+) Transcript_9090:298-1059(+)